MGGLVGASRGAALLPSELPDTDLCRAYQRSMLGDAHRRITILEYSS